MHKHRLLVVLCFGNKLWVDDVVSNFIWLHHMETAVSFTANQNI